MPGRLLAPARCPRLQYEAYQNQLLKSKMHEHQTPFLSNGSLSPSQKKGVTSNLTWVTRGHLTLRRCTPLHVDSPADSLPLSLLFPLLTSDRQTSRFVSFRPHGPRSSLEYSYIRSPDACFLIYLAPRLLAI